MKNTNTSIPNSESQIPNSDLTYEQGFARIEEIVRLIERGDAPLDKSLALYEEGAQLIKMCGKMLDDAEQIVLRLQKGENGEPREILFDED